MKKDTTFGVLFKSNSKGEKKFEDFSQLTPAGKRLTFVLINLALGISFDFWIKTYMKAYSICS